MKRRFGMHAVGGFLCVALLSAPWTAPLRGQGAGPEPMKLQVGDAAPDFKLQFFTGSDLKDVHLSDYKGKKNVVLAFYVFAFTGG
jgi:hypothetical protein